MYARFAVAYCANPEPNEEDWELEFQECTKGTANCPSDVVFTVNGSMGVVEIGRVAEQHYGSYVINVRNDYGQAEEAEFTLTRPDDTVCNILYHRLLELKTTHSVTYRVDESEHGRGFAYSYQPLIRLNQMCILLRG